MLPLPEVKNKASARQQVPLWSSDLVLHVVKERTAGPRNVGFCGYFYISVGDNFYCTHISTTTHHSLQAAMTFTTWPRNPPQQKNELQLERQPPWIIYTYKLYLIMLILCYRCGHYDGRWDINTIQPTVYKYTKDNPIKSGIWKW